jgi:hypothetical protein
VGVGVLLNMSETSETGREEPPYGRGGAGADAGVSARAVGHAYDSTGGTGGAPGAGSGRAVGQAYESTGGAGEFAAE